METAWNSELPHRGLQLWEDSWPHHLCCRRKDQHFVLPKTEISYWLEPHSLAFFLYTHTWVACPGVKACLCNSLRPLSLYPSFLVLLPQIPLCCLSPFFPPPFSLLLYPLPLILSLSLSLSPYTTQFKSAFDELRKIEWRQKDEFQGQSLTVLEFNQTKIIRVPSPYFCRFSM